PAARESAAQYVADPHRPTRAVASQGNRETPKCPPPGCRTSAARVHAFRHKPQRSRAAMPAREPGGGPCPALLRGGATGLSSKDSRHRQPEKSGSPPPDVRGKPR